MNKIQMAANEYQDRKHRLTHPEGKFEDGGRWYPSDNEECDCCEGIRPPSSKYPYSLLTHCRTLKHVANLYDVSSEEIKVLING